MSHHAPIRPLRAAVTAAAATLAVAAGVLTAIGGPSQAAGTQSAPAAVAADLPAHVLTGYWHNFDNGSGVLRLRDVPDDYGIVAVAFADAVPSRPGAIDFTLDPAVTSALGGYDEAAFKADIAALQAEGRKVVISVGGQNGTVHLDDTAAGAAFAESTLALMDEFGFDGVDIDLENAPNLQHMTEALRAIDAQQPGYVLTMAPETIYVQPGGSYLALIDQVKDLITVVNTQYYNSGSMIGRDGKVYSAGTVDFQTALADILLDGHLRADQVGLGLPAIPQAAGSGYVAPDVVNQALDCLATGQRCGSYRPAATYPTIRGAMTWSINWDRTNGYAFATTVGGHLSSLPGGGGVTTPPTTPPTTHPAHDAAHHPADHAADQPACRLCRRTCLVGHRGLHRRHARCPTPGTAGRPSGGRRARRRGSRTGTSGATREPADPQAGAGRVALSGSAVRPSDVRRPLRQWCLPAADEGEQPPAEARAEPGRGDEAERYAGAVEDHRDRGTREGRGGVERALEDHRDPPREEVADDPSPDAGDHAQEGRRQRPESVVDRLERTGHAEQREPEGVEEGHHPLEPTDGGVEEEGEQPGGRRHEQVAPVGERGRWRRTDQDVADEAATQPGHTGQDGGGEEVEVLAHRHQRAGHGEHEDAGQVEHDEGRGELGVRHPRRLGPGGR